MLFRSQRASSPPASNTPSTAQKIELWGGRKYGEKTEMQLNSRAGVDIVLPLHRCTGGRETYHTCIFIKICHGEIGKQSLRF